MEPTLEPKDNTGRRNTKEAVEPVNECPESARCKVDPENLLGLVGILSTVLNLLVVVLVYVLTPV